MRRTRYLLVAILLSSAFSLLSGLPAFSQDPPDVSLGMTPGTVYRVGDIDGVDMATLRLNVHIPLLVDHSQRGKLNFTYETYNGSTGAWHVNCTSPQYLTGCAWYSGQNAITKYPIGGIWFGANGVLWPGSESERECCFGNAGVYYTFRVQTAIDTSGPSHQLGTVTSTPYVAESIDGSGIREFVDSNGWQALTNNDGVQFHTTGSTTGGPLGSLVEDPNGNEITTSVSPPNTYTAKFGSFPDSYIFGYGSSNSTTTDTLGRSWTWTETTDFSSCPVTAVDAYIWGTPGYSGGTRNFKFCLSAIPISTNFHLLIGSQYPTEYSGTWNLLTGIVLPDGTSWQFNYTSYGDVAKIYLPTGGTITYTWTSVPDGCTYAGNVYIDYLCVLTSRVVYDGNNSNTWAYSLAFNSGNTTSTVTDPLQNDSVYTPGGSCASYITQVQTYSGTGSNRTLLKTVAINYQGLSDPYADDMDILDLPLLLLNTATTLPNGKVSEISYTYDSGFSFIDTNLYAADGSGPFTGLYGLVQTESHNDWNTGSPGPVLSTTNTTYLALSNATIASSYRSANLLNYPYVQSVTDSGGHLCSETDYGYDESTADPSGVTMQHVSAPNSVRGNLTSVTSQAFANPCTSTSPSMTPFKTVNHAYDTGMIHTTTDPNQNTTTYAHSPTFYGAYVTQTTMPSTSSPNPANHVISGNYDFNTGLLTSFTDQNSNTTNYTYDVMLRPTNVTYPSPDGGQTNLYYPSTTTVELKKQIDATRWTDSFVYYDGLGRECRRTSANDESNPWDEVDTMYDAVARVSFKSYPYQGPGTPPSGACSSTQPGDTFAYDPLNRVTQVTHSDGSTVLTTYSDSNNHTGRATSVQDEGNGTQRVQRISQVDGMGRLASVCEVSSAAQLGSGGTPGACGQDIAGTGFLTTYGYDALSNLTSVSQGGYLPRSFAYDSLSRLVTATNPESDTINYKYDSDTNCSQPNSFATLLVSRTDARGIRTCMRYDALNRLTQKNYSNGTPTATFNFDETSAYGVALANTTGRASSDSTASPNPTGEIFSYDKLGHVRINSQCTPQNCGTPAVFPINYTYDLLGDTLTATNGAGVTITYPPYNRALRITGMTSSLSDTNHPGTLLSSPSYNAAGSVLLESIGNAGSSVTETRKYDGRLRLCSITDGSIYSVTIPSNTPNQCPQGSTNGYAPDGDTLQAIDSANTTWSYAYDEMNRLCSANNSSTLPVCHQSGLYQYKYDRFGNMWNGDGSLNITFNLGNNNRIDNLISNYDAAGNLLYDGATNYTYDSENRIITTANTFTGVTASYVYDANGRRTRKTTSNGGTVDFLYDLADHEITQLISGGAWTRGEVYAGSRHLATYTGGTGGTTVFNFSDWLGTERARSSPGATTACEAITSLPFGDGQITSGSCGDPSPMHFTGKERDFESGLDYFGARHYSSQFGRFMIPDWTTLPQSIPYADLHRPQTLNLFTYLANNPVLKNDPDGHNGTGVTMEYIRLRMTPEGRAQMDKELNEHPVRTTVAPVLALGGWVTGAMFAGPLVEVGLIRFAPLATAAGTALQKARDTATTAIEDLKSVNLSNVTSSRVDKALNSLSDHVTNMDIKGAIQEANGMLQGNHAAGELADTVKSLDNLKNSLEGALQNPNLASETRIVFNQAVQGINKFIQTAQPIIDAAKKRQQ